MLKERVFWKDVSNISITFLSLRWHIKNIWKKLNFRKLSDKNSILDKKQFTLCCQQGESNEEKYALLSFSSATESIIKKWLKKGNIYEELDLGNVANQE